MQCKYRTIHFRISEVIIDQLTCLVRSYFPSHIENRFKQYLVNLFRTANIHTIYMNEIEFPAILLKFLYHFQIWHCFPDPWYPWYVQTTWRPIILDPFCQKWLDSFFLFLTTRNLWRLVIASQKVHYFFIYQYILIHFIPIIYN